MNTRSFAILVATLFVCAHLYSAEEPISISMAIPAQPQAKGGRIIGQRDGTARFHVIITNTSKKPQKIWQEWCSWGYFGLTFELTDSRGEKWHAKKKTRDWVGNYPDWWILEPNESMVWDVELLKSDDWIGFPKPGQKPNEVTMKAVIEFFPNEHSNQHGVWTGRVVSKPLKVVFYPYL